MLPGGDGCHRGMMGARQGVMEVMGACRGVMEMTGARQEGAILSREPWVLISRESPSRTVGSESRADISLHIRWLRPVLTTTSTHR